MDTHGRLMTRARQALTLVELLVALALAVVLAGVTFSVVGTAFRGADLQAQHRERGGVTARAYDALARDLACAACPWEATNPALILAPPSNGAGGCALSFYTAVPDGEADTPDTYALRQTRYFLEALPSGTGCGLVCETAGLCPEPGPGGKSNRTVWAGIRRFEVAVFDGIRWTQSWPGAGSPGLPHAARVLLGGGSTSEAAVAGGDIFIPAGRVVPASARTGRLEAKARNGFSAPRW